LILGNKVGVAIQVRVFRYNFFFDVSSIVPPINQKDLISIPLPKFSPFVVGVPLMATNFSLALIR
jgi:hypothetical protein